MPAAKKKSLRVREIAAIKMLQKKLGIDDGSYRAILVDHTGYDSLGNPAVTSAGRQKVIDHLRDLERRMGLAEDRPRWQPLAGGSRQRRGSEMGFRDIDTGREKKVRMMWLHLHDLGEVEAATEQAMNRWIKRQTGVSSLNWLENAGRLNDVIEQLKQWTDRVERAAR